MTKLNELAKSVGTESFVVCEASPEGYPKLTQYVLVCVDSATNTPVWSRWFFSEQHALTALERAVQLSNMTATEIVVG